MFHHPQTTLLSFHIKDTPSPCVAREIRCCTGGIMEGSSNARSYERIHQVFRSLVHSFILVISLSRLPRVRSSSSLRPIYEPEFVNPAAFPHPFLGLDRRTCVGERWSARDPRPCPRSIAADGYTQLPRGWLMFFLPRRVRAISAYMMCIPNPTFSSVRRLQRGLL